MKKVDKDWWGAYDFVHVGKKSYHWDRHSCGILVVE